MVPGVCARSAGSLPATVVDDVAGETESLLSRAGAEGLDLVLFLSPTDAARLPEATRNPPGRWVAVLLDPQAGDPPARAHPSVLDYRTTEPADAEIGHLLRRAWATLDALRAEQQITTQRVAELAETASDLESLVHIGQALSQEKDPERLLRTILATSKKITGADAGSIFLVEADERGAKRLRFKYSHTFSKDLPYEEQVMPLEQGSLAGYVAVTGNVLNIPDVHHLDHRHPYRFDSTWDRDFDYRTCSMLAVPMRNHLDDVIGVIQLINCKESAHPVTGNEAFEVRLVNTEDFRTRVVAFPARYEGLMQAVASQAAIAIENNRMILRIRSQFEEFVRASVAAIESRDPATSGHSFRVTQMCLNTARAVNRATTGPYAGTRISEHGLRVLELAGLLHDFGKVYIEPAVFLKARRLYPRDYDYLMLRLEYVHRSIELEQARAPRSAVVDGYTRRLATLREIMDRVGRLNDPTVVAEGRQRVVREIRDLQGEIQVADLAGNPVPLLNDEEAANLSIERGTLNDGERRAIESHVTFTAAFVEKIPWPAEFRDIPRIARAHHERLDGSGYPDGLRGSQIQVPARIMAIADVYDALSAADRPYKKAVPQERVFAILRDEAAAGKLDADLVEIFIRDEAYVVASTGGPTTGG
jgi:HD-GYP domain-containing protein (c-di-GMP phosphodiesterase class II)